MSIAAYPVPSGVTAIAGCVEGRRRFGQVIANDPEAADAKNCDKVAGARTAVA